MKRVNKEYIEELSSRENVDPEPVWNFLGTIPHDTTLADNYLNLSLDARLYGWSEETVQAIREGINKTFES